MAADEGQAAPFQMASGLSLVEIITLTDILFSDRSHNKRFRNKHRLHGHARVANVNKITLSYQQLQCIKTAMYQQLSVSKLQCLKVAMYQRL